jgi:hypothetical protein
VWKAGKGAKQNVFAFHLSAINVILTLNTHWLKALRQLFIVETQRRQDRG